MFLLNNNPLPLDTAFQDAEGNSYPANWLRLASQSEREAIGITEVADQEPTFNPVYYWDKDLAKALEDKEEVNSDGSPIYVQVLGTVDGKPAMVNSTKRLVTKGLKSVTKDQVRHTAYTILLQTDWAVVRKAERGIEIPADITTYRADVLATLDDLETVISSVTTVEELASINLSFPSKA